MKKNRPVSVRLTEEQRADLDLVASAKGTTPSAYLRDLLADDRQARSGRPAEPRSEARVADAAEILAILSSEARAGDVSAARLVLRHHQAAAKPPAETPGEPRADEKPKSPFDELAARRGAASG